MASRSIAQIAPTSSTIAMNAYIFGFGGHSLVTPHATIQSLWWTDKRIEDKVTRAYVVSKLRGEEREFLDRPLAFGEGLTDDTYMEWILEKAKRLFVILSEVGVPDQVFGCIDDCWADDDLPLSKEDVEGLELSYERDEALNRRFYDLQFTFLLRELSFGAHIDYGLNEHIPMDYVDSIAVAAPIQAWDRIHFPGRPDEVYMRRKFSLHDKETGQEYRQVFLRDIKRANELAHQHIAPIWASYTFDDAGYVLFDFIGNHTLQSFIDHRGPAQWQRIPTHQRPFRLCEWMHCLADTLAFLHDRGVAHTGIRPSNIIIDPNSKIALADAGGVRMFQKGKKVNPVEVYNYAAPESSIAQTPFVFSPGSPGSSGAGMFGKTNPSSSPGSSANGMNTRNSSVCSDPFDVPRSPTPTGRSSENAGIPIRSSFQRSNNPFRNFGRHLPGSSPSASTSLRGSRPLFSPTPTQNHSDLPDLPALQSDIFSLGCIFLDILTFMLRNRTTDFVKHRTTRISGVHTGGGKRNKTDTSFHFSPQIIESWFHVLESDARKVLASSSSSNARSASPIHRAVPTLLALIKRMLCQNASMRPSAIEVRDALKEVLTMKCGFPLHTLCCGEREWGQDVHQTVTDSPSAEARPPPLAPQNKHMSSQASVRNLMDLFEPLLEGRDEDDGISVEEIESPITGDGPSESQLSTLSSSSSCPSSSSTSLSPSLPSKTELEVPSDLAYSPVSSYSSCSPQHPGVPVSWMEKPTARGDDGHRLQQRESEQEKRAHKQKRFNMTAVQEEEDESYAKHSKAEIPSSRRRIYRNPEEKRGDEGSRGRGNTRAKKSVDWEMLTQPPTLKPSPRSLERLNRSSNVGEALRKAFSRH